MTSMKGAIFFLTSCFFAPGLTHTSVLYFKSELQANKIFQWGYPHTKRVKWLYCLRKLNIYPHLKNDHSFTLRLISSASFLLHFSGLRSCESLHPIVVDVKMPRDIPSLVKRGSKGEGIGLRATWDHALGEYNFIILPSKTKGALNTCTPEVASRQDLRLYLL